MVLAHRKELIDQNAAKIKALLPDMSVGLYSAGLRRYAMDEDIIVAGIQSIHKKAPLFGRRHLCIIDEVHLVPRDGEGMYRTFLEELAELNPRLRLTGLTATPYRTGEGSICTKDGLFQAVCYEAKLQPLIAGGYLCPITSAPAVASVDTSNLRIRAGEFVAGEMERLFGDNVSAACEEIVSKTGGRHSVMVFCAGVLHARDVADCLERLTGERVGVVTGESSALERGAALEDFRARRLRWLVNVDVLTTGFDAPCVDAIAVLRATASPGLFAQICGRGLRPDPSKTNCLVLDFGENIKRHGPIDSPDYGKRSERRRGGAPMEGEPGKECPGCGERVAPSTKRCPCGFIFPANHEAEADASNILSAPERFRVVEVSLSRHKKRGATDKPDTLRVDYICEPEAGGNLQERISEWVCLEHQGFAYTKACLWWRSHSVVEPIPDIDEAIAWWKRGAVAEPHHIAAIREGKFWKIIKAELNAKPTEWEEELPEPAGDEWEAADLPF
jgi:DNA repair protein RadD